MELTAQKREIFGKKVKTLQEQGLIPAEFYGNGIENIHLVVPTKEFRKIFKEAGESTVIDLLIDGKKNKVLIYDVSKKSITGEISHIDFYGIKMDEKIKIKVPLEFIGEAPAVKEKSGVLVKAMQEIEVEALPGDLPHNIAVNLSSLMDIGSNILVKDIAVDKVKFLASSEAVIATIIEQKEEEVVVPASVADVKVETEEKKEARDKEKEEKEKK